LEVRPEPALSESLALSEVEWAERPSPEDFDGPEGRGQRSAREAASASYGVSSASSLSLTLDICTENASRRNTYGCASTDA
jgi:hypothetical protein